MPREFNIKINESVLQNTNHSPIKTDDEMSKIMKMGDEIVEVFRRNKASMYDAYLILGAMADSIYLTATFGDDK